MANIQLICRKGHNDWYVSPKGRRCCRVCKSTGNIEKRRHERMEVVLAYGDHCECCGEWRYEFLAIDHINGGGNRHMAELGNQKIRFYRWLKRNNYPEGYRILCHNCNQSLGNLGYCPHEEQMPLVMGKEVI